MPKRKPSCFVSYCHEDTNKAAVECLVDELRAIAGTDIHIHWDRELLTGTRLGEFMDNIFTCDAVIMLLSPAYKKRIDNREKGAFEEYQRIMHRLTTIDTLRRKPNKTEAEEQATREAAFSLFPYLFQGTGETSCPSSLQDLKHESLTQWTVHRDTHGNQYVPDTARKHYRSEFKRIITHITSNHLTRAPLFSELYDELFKQLFRKVKHEDTKGYLDDNPDVAEQLFVKTHFYEEVKTQRAYILTGRKGTGKTTLTDNLAKIHKNRYKEHFPIKLDEFELETIVAMLSIPQIASDTSFVVRRERVFRIAWEIFIYVHCMEIVLWEHKHRGLKQSQQKAVPYLEEFMSKTFQRDVSKEPLRKTAIYMWALNQVLEHINLGISRSRVDNSSAFFHDLDESTSNEKIIEAVFSREVLFPFTNILKECTKRFLISLDGFDRNFDDYRRKAKSRGQEEADIYHIVMLENDWVRSLLYLCRVMKCQKDRWGLYPIVDFCVTVPKDRCLEIMREERDSVAYIGSICEMKWSGIELAIMLRKRLEVLHKYVKADEKDAVKRFNSVLRAVIPELPQETAVKISGRSVSIPLFIDVLRHSFWRPRDILMYYTSILATYRYLKKINMEFDAEMIAKKISDTTFDVIGREFIGEFQSSLRNIEQVISVFRGSKQTIPSAELETLLAKTDYDFADSLQCSKTSKEKARFLFEIGFIGVRCPQTIQERFKLLIDDVFYFNDAGTLEKIINDDSWKDCTIIIHPIFCEYLNLDTKQQDLALKYTWPYLRKQEVIEYSTNTL